VSEPRADYADTTNQLRELRSLEPGTKKYQRQRGAIIEQTLPLAEHVARRFPGRGQSHEDLVQVASI
jgi:RNA polymerase sigma-B factor